MKDEALLRLLGLVRLKVQRLEVDLVAGAMECSPSAAVCSTQTRGLALRLGGEEQMVNKCNTA